MKHLITFFAIFLFPITLLASEQAWKNFTQEQTVLIVHVDLTKVDIAKSIQNNQPIVDAVKQAIGTEMDTRSIIAAGELGKLYLTQTLGIQEAYLVVNVQMPSAVAIILPQTGKINVETLGSSALSLLGPPKLPIESSKDGKFVLISLPVRAPDDWTGLFLPATPTERPDFAEAFAAIEDAPIKIVAALPNFVRRVVRDTSPRLPSPFDKLDIVTPLSELRWTAIGIDPAKSSINVTAALTSELVAANVRKSLQDVLTIWIEKGIEELEVLPDNDNFKIKSLLPTFKNRADWIHSMLIPKLEGNNLVLRWEQSQFNEVLETAMPLIEQISHEQAVRMARQPCINHMKQFVLAFHNYADSSGQDRCLPPPFTVDADGKPLHSWRVLVLPYVDQLALYRQIRLDEPWDSEHNKQFHDQMPAIFRCSAGTGNPDRDTVFCMIVGNETIGVPNGKGITFYQITDGSSNTILLTERKTPVNWMEPVDILQEHAYLGVNQHEFGIGSEHPGGAIIGIADGSVHFMRENIPLATLKGLLMKAGGASVIYNWEERRPYLESGR